VREVCKASFAVDPQKVNLETAARDIPGWDSVGQLSLGSELEEVFHISLEVDEMMALKNVRDVVRVIQTKLAAQT
jgi:acyl carrier protein